MKIIYISDRYYPDMSGGSEHSLKILVDSLRTDIEPVVITLTDNKSDCIRILNNIKVYYIARHESTLKDNSYFRLNIIHNQDLLKLSLTKKIMLIIDKEKPHLVHSNNLRGMGVYLWHLIKKRNIPIVHTLRDYYLMCAYSSMFWKGKNCAKSCYHCLLHARTCRFFSRYVDAVVGNSEYILQRHIKAGYFSHAVLQKIVYNAPNMVLVNRKRLPGTQTISLGYIGRIVPEKGIEMLLNVLFSLKEDTWKLIIAGTGDEFYCSTLKKKHKDRRVTWMGWVKAEEFYQTVDYTILPALWQEPLSRVILESFSYGIPVIASNRGGSNELIKDGINGFLFNPDSPKELINILKQITRRNINYAYLSKNCRKNSRQFSTNRLRTEYLQIYTRLITQAW